MTRTRDPIAALALAVLAAVILLPRTAASQAPLDEEGVALIYHKLSGEPLDVDAVAARSRTVTSASQFDRPDVLEAEAVRLRTALSNVDPRREFDVRVNDHISQYDHARGEFSVGLFQPGFYVQVDAFGQAYQLVFANADAARAIAMPKEEARVFDASLNRIGRAVTNEIRFRVIGKGDPAGGVTGPNVIRAEILSTRLLDREGTVIFTPKVSAPPSAIAATDGFDVLRADVAGFRVGVKAKDLQATLERLFGPVTRRERANGWHAGYAAGLFVNEMGCMSLEWKSQRAVPGSVCVTAYLDGDDVVRSIRIERVFPWMDGELFRSTLVRRYGPVADAKQGVGFALGWGPRVDPALVYDRTGPATAVAAYYISEADFLSRSGNALAPVRVVLQLVDARWASAQTP